MSNYISVKLGGVERGLKFNQYAIEQYYQRISWDKYVEASEIYAMFYAGLLGNCYVKQVEADFTFEDVSDWVDALYFDDAGKEVIKLVSKTMTDTEQYKRALEEMKKRIRAMSGKVETEEPKKKEEKMKSSRTGSTSTK